MKRLWKIFRAVVMTLFVLAIIVPSAVYVMLSTSWARQKLRDVAVSELSALLGTAVHVDEVKVYPFNRVSVAGVTVDDDSGRKALSVGDIDARFELRHFLLTHEIVVDYVMLDSVDLRLWRASESAPLNIAGIIDRFKPSGPNRQKKHFELAVNTVVVRRGHFVYDVADAPPPDSARFDRRHVELSDIGFNARIPVLSENTYGVVVGSMGFVERSGFMLSDLNASVEFSPTRLSVGALKVALPRSQLLVEPVLLTYDRPADIVHSPGTVTIAGGSVVHLPDLAAFLPVLAGVDRTLSLSGRVAGTPETLRVESLTVNDSENSRFDMTLTGTVSSLTAIDDLRFSLDRLALSTTGIELVNFMTWSGRTDRAATAALMAFGKVSLTATASGTVADASADVRLASEAGNVVADVRLESPDRFRSFTYSIDTEVDNVDAGAISGHGAAGLVSLALEAEGLVDHGRVTADYDLTVPSLQYAGHTYSDMTSSGRIDNRGPVDLSLQVADALCPLSLTLAGSMSPSAYVLDTHIALDGIDFNAIRLTGSYPDYRLSGNIDLSAVINPRDIDSTTGRLAVAGLNYTDRSGEGLRINKISVNVDTTCIDVRSDFLNGSLDGSYAFTGIAPTVADIVSHVLPAYVDVPAHQYLDRRPHLRRANNFTFDFTLANAENITTFFNAPVQVIYPVEISGALDGESHCLNAVVDAPYLQQGDKIIENTTLYVSVDGEDHRAKVYGTGRFPTKKGPMMVTVDVQGTENRLDTRLDWMIERKIPINGALGFSTLFGRDDDHRFKADVNINPGTITFGNDVWSIRPSSITYADRYLAVDRFMMTTGEQTLAIDGSSGTAETPDSIKVSLDNIVLDHIFENLEIDNALIGGRATGIIYAADIFGGGMPRLTCPSLHVDNIGYNHCVLGDADIVARWDAERNGVYLDADITGPEDRHSRIDGYIIPATEGLDINFDANHVKVGFLKPFMSAFATDISGYASGRARLFGTFKYIDLEGEIFADSVKIGIDFTNTTYMATDSVHITPGSINLDNITITDVNGHTARLSGYVRHKFFKEPEFDFRVTDAVDFLSYNVNSRRSPDWYGTIYGNGGARITGWPGTVNIGVNMSTAPGSTFTFVLSDREDADEYSFITFRDRTPRPVRDSIIEASAVPKAVLDYQARMAARTADTPSAYNMNIQVDITPDAAITLVMDPVGGDEIKARGSGNLRMTYGSVNNDLKMYGTYTLDRGSYNFTLQNIIIKDFTIKEGSSIAFHGDPYVAQLDIKAAYAVNANLSDLDESFLHDKELNRTNVPVHAMLLVTGDMRQPDIHFDLEFPTLTSDVYRKVRSIVSTDEMMNRQIIYLLALNRFYTPEYMSTTKGNELFSVASSTIASQLSSMLGKLSENWSIAPNLRSDRGDFSDVEVDVALSSTLLNNRLLFNGNFGYRDKSLNTNQFVGDFDIEYLLNRRGSWRLKAYNRYNDQNYYLRTAQTTQGVGIMFKKDFDNFFSFLFNKRRKSKDAADKKSAPATPAGQ